MTGKLRNYTCIDLFARLVINFSFLNFSLVINLSANNKHEKPVLNFFYLEDYGAITIFGNLMAPVWERLACRWCAQSTTRISIYGPRRGLELELALHTPEKRLICTLQSCAGIRSAGVDLAKTSPLTPTLFNGSAQIAEPKYSKSRIKNIKIKNLRIWFQKSKIESQNRKISKSMNVNLEDASMTRWDKSSSSKWIPNMF